jgi:hypothetical protein
MAIDFFTTITESWFGATGDMTYVALGLILFFTIMLLFVGLDFKYSILLTSPLAIAMGEAGWFGVVWVQYAYWLLVVALGIYTTWQIISER